MKLLLLLIVATAVSASKFGEFVRKNRALCPIDETLVNNEEVVGVTPRMDMKCGAKGAETECSESNGEVCVVTHTGTFFCVKMTETCHTTFTQSRPSVWVWPTTFPQPPLPVVAPTVVPTPTFVVQKPKTVTETRPTFVLQVQPVVPKPSEPKVDVPEPTVCEDTHESCCQWAARDECRTNPFWMRVYCPKACGTCGCTVDRAPTCVVDLTNNGCPELPRPSVLPTVPKPPTKTEIPVFLAQEEVPVRTVQVVPDVRVIPMETMPPVVPTPTELVTPEPRTTTTTTCTNQHTYCLFWATIGECDKNPTYMSQFCRPACGLCEGTKPVPSTLFPVEPVTPTPTTTDECTDSNELCAFWESVDECKKNPEYMTVWCRRSCNTCDTPVPTTVTSVPVPQPVPSFVPHVVRPQVLFKHPTVSVQPTVVQPRPLTFVPFVQKPTPREQQVVWVMPTQTTGTFGTQQVIDNSVVPSTDFQQPQTIVFGIRRPNKA